MNTTFSTISYMLRSRTKDLTERELVDLANLAAAQGQAISP